MKTIAARAVAALCSSMMVTAGCNGVTVKVEKKPKSVDLSQAQSAQGNLNLANAEDFLQHLDNLKVVAADLLVKQLSQRDYVGVFRKGVRDYRSFLIARATAPVSGIKSLDDFYASSDNCRKTGLSFNMDKANAMLGLILQSAALAAMGEVNAGKLNGALPTELAAIGQLILMELGLKVAGKVDVDTSIAGVTKTTGTVSLYLAPIAGENVDQATKDADAKQVITMTFTRALGAEMVGSFDAVINMVHANAAGADESLEGKLMIARTNNSGVFSHAVRFDVGVKGAAASYARKMVFDQVSGHKDQIKITDILTPDSSSPLSYQTIVDVTAGTQCKVSSVAPGQGSESGFAGQSTATAAATATSSSTSSSTSTTADVPSQPSTPSSTATTSGVVIVPGTAPATSTATYSDGKGSTPSYTDTSKGYVPTDTDYSGKGSTYTGKPNSPGQTPSQSPVQYGK